MLVADGLPPFLQTLDAPSRPPSARRKLLDTDIDDLGKDADE